MTDTELLDWADKHECELLLRTTGNSYRWSAEMYGNGKIHRFTATTFRGAIQAAMDAEASKERR